MSKSLTSTSEFKLGINTINIVTFAVSAIIGLIIQVNYHAGRLPDNFLIAGMDRLTWNLIHIVSSIMASAGIILHLLINRKALKLILNPRGKKLNFSLRTSRFLIILLIIMTITGLLSLAFRLAGDISTRFHLIEIHDKIGILIFLSFIIHFIMHYKQYTKSLLKYMNRILSNLPKIRIHYPAKSHLLTKHIKLNNHKCIACWKCVNICPRHVIEKIDFSFHKHSHIRSAENCIGCCLCLKSCNSKAIEKLSIV